MYVTIVQTKNYSISSITVFIYAYHVVHNKKFSYIHLRIKISIGLTFPRNTHTIEKFTSVTVLINIKVNKTVPLTLMCILDFGNNLENIISSSGQRKHQMKKDARTLQRNTYICSLKNLNIPNITRMLILYSIR